MTRTPIAIVAGLAGFGLYVLAVVTLADQVLALPWPAQAAYFVIAGIAWVWPARALMVWAAAAARR
jgi:hypothetical protein